jgi:hypothetical protein
MAVNDDVLALILHELLSAHSQTRDRQSTLLAFGRVSKQWHRVASLEREYYAKGTDRIDSLNSLLAKRPAGRIKRLVLVFAGSNLEDRPHEHLAALLKNVSSVDDCGIGIQDKMRPWDVFSSDVWEEWTRFGGMRRLELCLDTNWSVYPSAGASRVVWNLEVLLKSAVFQRVLFAKERADRVWS